MKIVIANLYYDLLNLYGDSGNIKAIKKALESQKIKVEIINLSINDELDFEKYDFVTALDEIKKQFELEEYKKTIKDIESRNASLSIENIGLANKLNNIYNSKRWKLIDKAINILNKISRVK